MTFSEYQIAVHKTAVYPKETAKDYLWHGLAGEVGELSNKYKKVLRGDYAITDPVFKKGMIDECGDCAWYVFENANLYGIDMSEFSYSRRDFTITNCIESIYTKTFMGFRFHTRSEYFNIFEIKKGLHRIFNCICNIVDLLGFSVEEMLQGNNDKLFDRMERNMIKGNGDNR